ncbi:MAG TPA: translesion error-prone DNA polymerase V autoproteolytic subunit [Chitinophagaceae bacterium]|jgi:DNA polymerase V|nr:translesion error-prone DNA polymerase V autoproteolytic subunit [Chitinophagaceae bacterium]
MDGEIFFGAEGSYRGSKQFTQQDIKTANATGFGAAADDYMERGIDLNEELIGNKPATFFMRMQGDAMTGAGIYSGDLLIVDRSLKVTSGKIVVVTLNGEMMVRRLEKTFNKLRLMPESPRLTTIEVDPSGNDFSIWGVVTYTIHTVS